MDRLVFSIIFVVLFLTVPRHREYEAAKTNFYRVLDSLEGTAFSRHARPAVLTGYRSLGKGLLGWNAGKGSEVTVCTNGCRNTILHVLLHELAHQTVPEYRHSKAFWRNLDILKEIARQEGAYRSITLPEEICGAHVTDD
jgi:hypothetical protein